MKYFKLDKDKREIIIDKYKKYNVNVDILDLIIDLQQEIDRLNNVINKLEKDLKKRKDIYTNMNGSMNGVAVGCFIYVLDKLKELKDSDK